MSRPFELIAEYKPAGDQGPAIEALCEGIGAGLAHQTLLGVTGSGKSVGYDDSVFVVEVVGGVRQTQVCRVGELIDNLFREYDAGHTGDGDTQVLSPPRSRRFYAYAFDSSSGATDLHRITEFTRHSAPQMYRVRTKCGREVHLTGDHNLWVLRDGELTLRETEGVQCGDYLPIPTDLSYKSYLSSFDVLRYLEGSTLKVRADAALLACEQQQDTAYIRRALSGAGMQSGSMLFAARHRTRGRGFSIDSYRRRPQETDSLDDFHESTAVRIGGNKTHNEIPVPLLLTDNFLRLLGYHIAEGNCQDGYLILAGQNPVIRDHIERALNELGLTYFVRPNNDYRVSSTALTTLLGSLCGKRSRDKRLPPFWASLSTEQLGVLLRAYFDGVGAIAPPGEVTATTLSKSLASELAYALLRFGISARLSSRCKDAPNNNHVGDFHAEVSISGRENLTLFLDSVGFDISKKQQALSAVARRRSNTNVDVVPICGEKLRALRDELGLSMKVLSARAGISRSSLGLIEAQKRHPSRRVLSKVLEALLALSRERRVVPVSWQREWLAMERLCHVRWSRITELAPAKYDFPFVYDLSVPGPQTFLAGSGGIFVHNTFSIANVIQTHQRPTLVLAPNKTLAAQLYGEMREFFPHNAVEYFVSYYDYYQPEAYVPTTDTYIEKDASINEHIEQMRLSATKSLLERADSIIVATVSAIYGLGDPESFHAMVLHLARGDVIDQRKILRRLAELQYKRNDVELHRGNYRVRGDIIDIYPAESEREAVRVELFDEEIESLSFFDPLTGEVLRRVPRLTIYPKSHYVTERQTVLDAIEAIKIELVERLENLRSVNKLVEAQRLEQRTRFDIEMMQELGHCKGIENYSRFLSGRNPGEAPPTLFDYLPPEALLIIDESHVTVPQLGGMYRGDRSRKETLVEYGFRLPSALDNRPLRFDEFEKLAPQTIFVSATPGPYEHEHSDEVVEQVVRPTGLVDPQVEVKPASTQVDDLMSEIGRRVELKERVLVTTLTKRMAEDLTDYLSEHGIRVRYLHSDIDTVERVEIIRDLRIGEFDVLVGINLLREGLDMPEVSLVAILDADKEGFLRSDRSLIQTVGRAARNINGTAILYADNMTGSMRRALDETDRRREKQIQHNQKHGITPKGIHKAVSDIMEGAYAITGSGGRRGFRAAQDKAKYAAMAPDQLAKTIRALEQKMYKHADNLEFEEAANMRDEIAEIREAGLGLPHLRSTGPKE